MAVKAIRESAEHHFLNTLEQLKANVKGWFYLHFKLSMKQAHQDYIKDLSKTEELISKSRIISDAFLSELLREVHDLRQGFAYLFTDNDIILLAYVGNEQEHAIIQNAYKKLVLKIGKEFSKSGRLSEAGPTFYNLPDDKMLSAKRFDAYYAMCDVHKVKSIPLRREKRRDPMVLIIEDDRFTASYTSNILSHQYELVVSREGEDGVCRYIDCAPDIVFLDIHLPGLSGHQTLQAIKAVDPKAFVVMLSVDTHRNSIIQASAAGAKNFIKKPFSKQRLIKTLRTSPFINKDFFQGDSLH